MKLFTYSLRIGISPTFNTEENIIKLIKFSKNAKIDDIQFIINVEELNNGHLTLEESKVWLDMISKYKGEIEKQGITVSLNPWTTTLHTDRGRKLKPGQNFTTMVDSKGNKSEVVACPLDKNFQSYISELYSEYAKRDFDTIWIEDDFRLHNHSPLEWGGCFCDEHMKLFSSIANEKLDRENFVKQVFAPGKPNNLRDVYLKGNSITMNNFATLLANAVYKVNKKTRIGLMTSDPEVHCIESRDWNQIFTNLSGDRDTICRPHLPAYTEACGIQFCKDFNRISRLTEYLLPKDVLVWPELDNMPHTCFSKSHRFQQFEIECSLSLCSDGITINIFDQMGNGINESQNNDKYLADIKPYIEAVKKTNIKREQEKGITILYSENACKNLHSHGGDTPAAILPDETFFAQYLSSYGFAYRYSDDINIQSEVVAISNQFLRNLNNEEILCLFKNNKVILDGSSVEILIERNLGHLINAQSCTWHALNNGDISYEEVCTEDIYQGLNHARMSTQAIHESLDGGDYLQVKYSSDDIQAHSVTKNYKDEIFGFGLVSVNNCIIFPFGNLSNKTSFLYNPVRKEMFENLLSEIPYIKDAYYVTLNHFKQTDRDILLLTNFSTDNFSNLELNIPFSFTACKKIDRTTGELKNIESIDINGLSSICLVLEN